MQTERRKDARSREASLVKAILARVRKSYGEPVGDDDDDNTMPTDDMTIDFIDQHGYML